MPQIELLRAIMASRYRRAARYYKRIGDLDRYEQYAAVARHYGAKP